MQERCLRIRISREGVDLPSYATKGSSGVDLRSSEDFSFAPGEWRIVGTGIFLEMPEGVEAQVRTRSGMAWNRGLVVMNSPGTIDSDYRGEVKVLLMNMSSERQEIKRGERIAQLVFTRVEKVEFEEVTKLGNTDRGEGGFGSTGV